MNTRRGLLCLLLAAGGSAWVGCGPVVTGPPPPVRVASAAQFTLACERRAIGAFDAARALIPDRELACAARVADLHGQPIEGATVTFFVEAGVASPERVTDVAGLAPLGYRTGSPLPLDVEPVALGAAPLDDASHTGVALAPAWMMPHRWVENPPALLALPPGSRAYTGREPRRPDPLRAGRTNNPRDTLVTLVAAVTGAEAFTDSNDNGTFDPGEPFVDLTEPFIDADDDGTQSGAESFVDVNQNGRWDGKNGRWDAETRVWVQERVLWTGVPAPADALATVPGVAEHRPTVAVMPASLALRCGSFVQVGSICQEALSTSNTRPAPVTVFFADPWFNTLAHEAEDGCALGPDATPPLVQMGSLAVTRDPMVFPAGEEVAVLVSDVRFSYAPQTWSPRRAAPLPFDRTLTCRATPAPGAPAVEFSAGIVGDID